MCLDRSAEGLRPAPKALSDPEIKSLAKNERKAHKSGSQWERAVRGKRKSVREEGERVCLCVCVHSDKRLTKVWMDMRTKVNKKLCYTCDWA